MTAILAPAGARLGLAPVLSARERRIASWAIAAALLLHIAIIIICLIDWAALLNLALAKADMPEAIPVTLVYAPPPAPPPPPPKPAVQPEPPQPQPQPPIAPRMSGSDEKTEAMLEDKPQPALPQAKSPPPEPTAQQKKPVPQRPGNKEPATVAPTTSAEREAVLAPETRKEAPLGPLFHSMRLPSQRGGAGQRDTAGDPYLNRLLEIVDSHRIYPPASAFFGDTERVAIYNMLIDPSGNLVQIMLVSSSGSSVADEAAGNMLRSSAPFPPLPANWPHIRTSIIAVMPIYPSPR